MQLTHACKEKQHLDLSPQAFREGSGLQNN